MRKHHDPLNRVVSGIVIGLSVLLLLFLPRAFYKAQVVQSSVIRLYDQVLSLPGCAKTGAGSCASLDRVADVDLKKTVKIERFVPGSGYIAVYVQDKKAPAGVTKGGFTYDQATFAPSSGTARVIAGSGLQVFERGNLILEFDQPYSDTERLALEHDILLYYLPHTDAQRQQFLAKLQTNPQGFADDKEQNKRDIALLCTALKGQAKIPNGCPDFGTSPTVSRDGTTTATTPGNTFTSNPNTLPELDFSARPTRRPEVTVLDNNRLTFIGEPVTIKVDQVVDPDGKCRFFQWQWQKTTEFQVAEVKVDPYVGDLFFIPQNVGSFTVNVRAKEACKELGTLSSAPVSVRVIVNDKTVAFPDLAEAPKYQNAMLELYHLGVLQGYADGTMRPNAPINRAEFLKILFLALQYNIEKTVYSPRYPDVTPDQWFARYVWQADELGVIKGYPDGQFHPERTVNLAEALKMAMGFSTLEIADGNVYTFTDFTSKDWFSRYIQTAFREGILDDIKPGTAVRPGQFLTRGKAALIVVRTLLFPNNHINYTNKDALRRPEVFEDFASFID
jgi:hypothetical protein